MEIQHDFIQWDQYLMQRFRSMRKDGEGCDFRLSCSEREFKVHRLVLAGCSDFVLGLEPTAKTIHYGDTISSNTLQLVVDFIYTGKLTYDENGDKKQLLFIARHLKMKSLIELLMKDVSQTKNCKDEVGTVMTDLMTPKQVIEKRVPRKSWNKNSPEKSSIEINDQTGDTNKNNFPSVPEQHSTINHNEIVTDSDKSTINSKNKDQNDSVSNSKSTCYDDNEKSSKLPKRKVSRNSKPVKRVSSRASKKNTRINSHSIITTPVSDQVIHENALRDFERQVTSSEKTNNESQNIPNVSIKKVHDENNLNYHHSSHLSDECGNDLELEEKNTSITENKDEEYEEQDVFSLQSGNQNMYAGKEVVNDSNPQLEMSILEHKDEECVEKDVFSLQSGNQNMYADQEVVNDSNPHLEMSILEHKDEEYVEQDVFSLQSGNQNMYADQQEIFNDSSSRLDMSILESEVDSLQNSTATINQNVIDNTNVENVDWETNEYQNSSITNEKYMGESKLDSNSSSPEWKINVAPNYPTDDEDNYIEETVPCRNVEDFDTEEIFHGFSTQEEVNIDSHVLPNNTDEIKENSGVEDEEIVDASSTRDKVNTDSNVSPNNTDDGTEEEHVVEQSKDENGCLSESCAEENENNDEGKYKDDSTIDEKVAETHHTQSRTWSNDDIFNYVPEPPEVTLHEFKVVDDPTQAVEHTKTPNVPSTSSNTSSIFNPASELPEIVLDNLVECNEIDDHTDVPKCSETPSVSSTSSNTSSIFDPVSWSSQITTGAFNTVNDLTQVPRRVETPSVPTTSIFDVHSESLNITSDTVVKTNGHSQDSELVETNNTFSNLSNNSIFDTVSEVPKCSETPSFSSASSNTSNIFEAVSESPEIILDDSVECNEIDDHTDVPKCSETLSVSSTSSNTSSSIFDPVSWSSEITTDAFDKANDLTQVPRRVETPGVPTNSIFDVVSESLNITSDTAVKTDDHSRVSELVETNNTFLNLSNNNIFDTVLEPPEIILDKCSQDVDDVSPNTSTYLNTSFFSFDLKPPEVILDKLNEPNIVPLKCDADGENATENVDEMKNVGDYDASKEIVVFNNDEVDKVQSNNNNENTLDLISRDSELVETNNTFSNLSNNSIFDTVSEVLKCSESSNASSTSSNTNGIFDPVSSPSEITMDAFDEANDLTQVPGRVETPGFLTTSIFDVDCESLNITSDTVVKTDNHSPDSELVETKNTFSNLSNNSIFDTVSEVPKCPETPSFSSTSSNTSSIFDSVSEPSETNLDDLVECNEIDDHTDVPECSETPSVSSTSSNTSSIFDPVSSPSEITMDAFDEANDLTQVPGRVETPGFPTTNIFDVDYESPNITSDTVVKTDNHSPDSELVESNNTFSNSFFDTVFEPPEIVLDKCSEDVDDIPPNTSTYSNTSFFSIDFKPAEVTLDQLNEPNIIVPPLKCDADEENVTENIDEMKNVCDYDASKEIVVFNNDEVDKVQSNNDENTPADLVSVPESTEILPGRFRAFEGPTPMPIALDYRMNQCDSFQTNSIIEQQKLFAESPSKYDSEIKFEDDDHSRGDSSECSDADKAEFKIFEHPSSVPGLNDNYEMRTDSATATIIDNQKVEVQLIDDENSLNQSSMARQKLASFTNTQSNSSPHNNANNIRRQIAFKVKFKEGMPMPPVKQLQDLCARNTLIKDRLINCEILKV